MDWIVEFDGDFEREFDAWSESVQDVVLAKLVLLAREGPSLRRPHADVLSGSRHANMKELRCVAADGVWRIAFAFDPDRRAILLAGGDKTGVQQTRFYRSLIAKADDRYDRHLMRMREKR